MKSLWVILARIAIEFDSILAVLIRHSHLVKVNTAIIVVAIAAAASTTKKKTVVILTLLLKSPSK